jgi:hypothetical protein
MTKRALLASMAALLAMLPTGGRSADNFYYRYPHPFPAIDGSAPVPEGNAGAPLPLSIRADGLQSVLSSGDVPNAGFSATGGTPPYTFSPDGPLPDGIDLNPDGTLTGSFTRTGKHTIAARVTDGKSATAVMSKVVEVRPAPPVISLSSPLSAIAGTPFSAAATQVQGGFLAYSLPSQPGWLTVDGAGAITGTVPANAQGFAFDVLGVDLFERSDRRSSGAVAVSPPAASLADAPARIVEGDALSGSFSTNMAGATWSKLTGPSWLTVAADGALSGQSADVPPGADAPVAFSARATLGTAVADASGLVTVAPSTVTVTGAQVRSGLPFSLPLATTMTAAGSYAATASPADVAGIATSATAVTGTAPSVSQSASRTITVARSASSGGAAATGSATLSVVPRLAFTTQPQNVLGTTGTALVSTNPAWSGLVGPTRTVLSRSGTDIGSTLPTLCPGLGFESGTGRFTGTPTDACSLSGLNLVTSDAAGTTVADAATSNGFSLTVVAQIPAPLGNGCSTPRDLYVNGGFSKALTECDGLSTAGVSSFTIDLRQVMRLTSFELGGSVSHDLTGVWEYGNGATWTAFPVQGQYIARTAAYSETPVTAVPILTARYVRWRYVSGTRSGNFSGLSAICRLNSNNTGTC